jgi:phosphatidate cytidylyltransferase
MSEPVTKKSELGTRTVSAVVMIAVAGTALWLDGWAWDILVVCISFGVLWEWRSLAAGFTKSLAASGIWNAAGIVYIGLGALALVLLRHQTSGLQMVLALVGTVIATDIGAYFTGRTFGGPKIAPRISPSKTWSGLLGGMLAAGIVFYVLFPGLCYDDCTSETFVLLPGSFNWLEFLGVLPFGATIAVIAQAGDFFESWMKRRAGVKDSGRLLPGHGGLFDRVDGLMAVMLMPGAILAIEHIVGFQ